MKNFEELENFIKNNLDDWKDKLKAAPYNLKSVTQFPINPNWYLLNYNLFESDLDNKIVKQCRGTCVEVIGNEVKVICAPYLKFFDINDVHADKINWDSKKLKTELKVDGMLQKCFKYNNRDYWVTNGGVCNETPLDFETDDVHNYKELLQKCLNEKCIITDNDFHCEAEWLKNVPDGWTLMFEVTSPQNKIICSYDQYKMWFHGARDSEGIEHSPEEVKEMFGIPYDIPKRYNLSKKEDILAALETFNGNEQEGFVVVDEENWTRVKMKCPSYLALKYIRDNDTPEGIWRLCICENHDDYPELKEKTDKQIEEINLFNKLIRKEFEKANYVSQNFADRKSYAIWVNKNTSSELKNLYFKAKDGMSADKYLETIWDKFKSAGKGYEMYCSIRDALHKDFSIPHSKAEK